MTVRNPAPLIRAASASAGFFPRSLALAARKERPVNALGRLVTRTGAMPKPKARACLLVQDQHGRAPLGHGTRWACQRQRGVTLLEITLAMGLLVLLTSMTYWFYGSSLETRAKGRERAHDLRLVRVVLDRIATEIRQASVITTDNRLGIKGEAERIWLSTLRVPSREVGKDYSYREQPPPAEYDLVKVEYRIVRHPEILDEEDGYECALGLGRVEHLIPRPDSLETGEALEDDGGLFIEPIGDEGTIEDQFFEDLYEDEQTGDVGLGPDIDWVPRWPDSGRCRQR